MTTRVACSNPPIEEGVILARFARRAAGMTGADVEYIVQQAKRAARREGRILEYSDVEKALDEARPRPSDENRWRYAIHEAAHAVIGLAFRFEHLEQITLSGRHGNPSVTSSFHERDIATEDRVMHLIIVGLSGRAAEELFFEAPCIYSGGAPESDLGRVTRLAYLLETSFGFGKEHKLVYREQRDFVTGLTSEPGLLERFNHRLEMSFRAASHLLAAHRGAVERLANELMQVETLDGEHLEDVLNEVRAIMERDLPPS